MSTHRSRRRRALRPGLVAAASLSLVAGAAVLTSSPALAAGTSCALDARFGRMFPTLPSATWSLSDLSQLAEKTNEVNHFQPPAGVLPTDEMVDFPAGYNYFGQFVDHDITLDDRPNDLTTPVAPSTLTNLRTPQLDLDSVYASNPALYEADGHMKLGADLTGAESDRNAHDLLRGANGQALIGDPRNDENKIVASFHSIVTRFHNKMLDVVKRDHPSWTTVQVFAETKRQVIWSYQYALLTDFLPKMVGPTELAGVVTRQYKAGWTTNLKFYDSCNGSMPLEFSGAAYRFGHSLVRNDYEINERHADLPVFTADMAQNRSLVGFGPAPSDFAIDWKYFLKVAERPATKPQDAYQFDNSLVPALRLIPGPAAGTQSTILATRNLLRGQQLGLPSGQDVARAMGVTPLPDSKILVGPAVVGSPAGNTVPITSVSPAFAGKAPLWTYILAEAAAYNTVQSTINPGQILGLARLPERLGPVGGRIVAETIVGLLKADPTSVLNNPTWSPDARFTTLPDRFTLSDIVSVATNLGPTGLDQAFVDKVDGQIDIGKSILRLPVLKSFTVWNRSTATVSVGVPTYTGAADIRIFSSDCGGLTKSLLPGLWCTVTVLYTPLGAGARNGRVSIPTTGASGTIVADLKAATA